MITQILYTFSLALMLFVAAPAAHAQTDATSDIVGTVLEVEGAATITMQGVAQAQPLKVNMPVHTGDIIVTGPAAKAYVMLIDNTELTLSENGQLSIDDYNFNDRDSTNNSATYSVLKGAFLYVSGLVAKKENPDVTVNVPQGSIGIRGTRFWGGEVDGEYGIVVGDGEVEVDSGAGTKTRIRKGEGAAFKGRGKPMDKPKIWAKERIERATKTVALKNPADVGRRIQANAPRRELLRDRHREIMQKRIEQRRLESGTAKPIPGAGNATQVLDNSDRLRKMRLEAIKNRQGALPLRTPEQTAGMVRAAPLGNIPRNIIVGEKDVTQPLRDRIGSTMEKTTESTNSATSDVAPKVGERLQAAIESTKETVAPVKETVAPVIDTTAKAVTQTAKPVEQIIQKPATSAVTPRLQQQRKRP